MMNRLDEIRETAGVRSKALLGTVADILETLSRQNLAVADDVSRFAVAQVRLPTQADDFTDYRARTRNAYAAFGRTLKSHGSDYIGMLREFPGQITASLVAQPKPARVPEVAKTVKVTAKSKTVTKKKAPRKTTAKKAAAKPTSRKAA